MPITAIPDLPILDARTLTYEQVDRCHAVFEDFRDRSLLPANEAYRDETRKALDRALLFGITSVLQLDLGLEEEWDYVKRTGRSRKQNSRLQGIVKRLPRD